MRATHPSLVPELLVASTPRSLAFWCGLLGFGIDYQREEEGFARISRGTAQVMIEQEGVEQFLVTDPDGYLIRFQSALGRRPVSA